MTKKLRRDLRIQQWGLDWAQRALHPAHNISQSQILPHSLFVGDSFQNLGFQIEPFFFPWKCRALKNTGSLSKPSTRILLLRAPLHFTAAHSFRVIQHSLKSNAQSLLGNQWPYWRFDFSCIKYKCTIISDYIMTVSLSFRTLRSSTPPTWCSCTSWCARWPRRTSPRRGSCRPSCSRVYTSATGN